MAIDPSIPLQVDIKPFNLASTVTNAANMQKSIADAQQAQYAAQTQQIMQAAGNKYWQHETDANGKPTSVPKLGPSGIPLPVQQNTTLGPNGEAPAPTTEDQAYSGVVNFLAANGRPEMATQMQQHRIDLKAAEARVTQIGYDTGTRDPEMSKPDSPVSIATRAKVEALGVPTSHNSSAADLINGPVSGQALKLAATSGIIGSDVKNASAQKIVANQNTQQLLDNITVSAGKLSPRIGDNKIASWFSQQTGKLEGDADAIAYKHAIDMYNNSPAGKAAPLNEDVTPSSLAKTLVSSKAALDTDNYNNRGLISNPTFKGATPQDIPRPVVAPTPAAETKLVMKNPITIRNPTGKGTTYISKKNYDKAKKDGYRD
jgi:hypothetical protein